MRRRDFIAGLGVAGLSGAAVACPLARAAIAWPLAAHAQQPGKLRRVGMLETVSPALNSANFNAFRAGLRDLGYVEGQNLVIEYRSADGRTDWFPQLAAELVGLNVDVIVTRGTPSALAAKNATDTIPVVMAAIGEPFSVLTSLARPGGNITGLSAFVVDLMPKRVELVRDMIPGIARIAAVLNLSNPIHASEWEQTRIATASMGIHCELFDVRRREDLASAFDAASERRAQALVIGLDTLTQTNRELIIELAARHRLPAIYASREFADAGGLITYGVSYPELYRRAAGYVDKLLKGAKPISLPVEQPAKFDLIINLSTAKTLALEIPLQLLARADAVIE